MTGLRELRERRGLRLLDVASPAQISVPMLSLAERGHKRLSPESAERVGAVFGVAGDVVQILVNNGGREKRNGA